MPPWFNTEQARLRALYPVATWEEIERELPRHTRKQIQSYACNALGLKRPCHQAVPKAPSDPLIQNLIDARETMGLSLSEFARRADMERGAIYRIERGRGPNLATLRRLCDALDLELVAVPKKKSEAE